MTIKLRSLPYRILQYDPESVLYRIAGHARLELTAKSRALALARSLGRVYRVAQLQSSGAYQILPWRSTDEVPTPRHVYGCEPDPNF